MKSEEPISPTIFNTFRKIVLISFMFLDQWFYCFIKIRYAYNKYLRNISSDQWKSLSCVHSLQPHRLYSPWNSPGRNTRVGSLSLLQQIFPTQESNWGLLNCRWILYQLSYEGSPYKVIRMIFKNHFTFYNLEIEMGDNVISFRNSLTPTTLTFNLSIYISTQIYAA